MRVFARPETAVVDAWNLNLVRAAMVRVALALLLLHLYLS